MDSPLDIEDIARRSGVSRSTVSRVLNNQTGVKSTTRERVLEVIRELDYQPNQAARALTMQRTETLALVMPVFLHYLFGDLYFPAFVRSVYATATQRNYLVTLWMGEKQTDEQWLYQRMIKRRAVDGVLIADAPDDDWLTEQLHIDNIPFVVMGRSSLNNVNYVDVDNRQASRQAVDHLMQLGYRRIGTITGPLNHTAGRDRLAGYTDAHYAAGRPLDQTLIVDGGFTEAGGYTAMQTLLKCGVDAVFAASDQMAIAAIRAIREAHLEVPKDIAVVGFDDVDEADQHGLTTVYQSPEAAGEAMTNLLIDLCLQKTPSVPRGILLPTQLVIRDSCGARLRGQFPNKTNGTRKQGLRE